MRTLRPVALIATLVLCLSCHRRCATNATAADAPPPPAPTLTTRTLAEGLDPVDFAADADSLYWIDVGRHAIMRLPKSGGAPRIVVDTNASGLALDDEDIYLFHPLDGPGPPLTSIQRVPKDGSAVAHVARIDGSALAIAASGASLYVFDGRSSLLEIPKAGGAPRVVARDASFSLPSLVADGSTLYLPSVPEEALLRIDAAGGPLVKVAAVATHWTSNVAVDGASIAWWAKARIWEVPKAGGTPRAIATLEVASGLAWIAADARGWYA